MIKSDEARRKEEGWFHEREKKLLDEFRKKREQKIKEAAEHEGAKRREELKKAHWMCCPKCGHAMKEVDLQGVQVDVCSACDGIFFDRGELEAVATKKADEKRSMFRKLLGFVE
jgi:uncharacterized protein